MKNPIASKPCTRCGTWTCARCGAVRKNVSLKDMLSCLKCGYDQGSMQAGQHTRGQWEKHNPGLPWNEPDANWPPA